MDDSLFMRGVEALHWIAFGEGKTFTDIKGHLEQYHVHKSEEEKKIAKDDMEKLEAAYDAAERILLEQVINEKLPIYGIERKPNGDVNGQHKQIPLDIFASGHWTISLLNNEMWHSPPTPRKRNPTWVDLRMKRIEIEQRWPKTTDNRKSLAPVRALVSDEEVTDLLVELAGQNNDFVPSREDSWKAIKGRFAHRVNRKLFESIFYKMRDNAPTYGVKFRKGGRPRKLG